MVLMPTRRLLLFVPLLFIFALTLLYGYQYQYQIRNTLSYASRPLWDHDEGPSKVVPHFYSEGLRMDSHTCNLHGWQKRRDEDKVKVLDAVLMSTELDLLEIRLNELDPVVDFFLIVESNATFTGLPKDTYFKKNSARFDRFRDKIIYSLYVSSFSQLIVIIEHVFDSIPGYPLSGGRVAWEVEAHTRSIMTVMLDQHMKTLPTPMKYLVVMSDLDEIPSVQTIQLLKACDFGDSIHLQLRNFLYR